MNRNSFNFPWAQAEDVISLVKLVNSAYRGEESKKGWTTEADLLEGQRVDHDQILELIEKKHSGILMMLDKGEKKILACVHLEMTSENPSEVYLGMLTVSPRLQNQGAGQILLEEVENKAREWKAQRITLGVIGQRNELIAWYQRRGYNLVGQRKPFPYGQPRFGIPQRDDLYFEMMEKKL